jgi:hypothetical protein
MFEDHDFSQQIAELSDLHEQLAQHHPESIALGLNLAASVVDPRIATAAQIWPVLWDKPLYANTKVTIATQWIERVHHILSAGQVWSEMSRGHGPFQINQVGPRNLDIGFELVGERAIQLRSLGIAARRINAVVGAGEALATRAAQHNGIPFADIADLTTEQAVDTLINDINGGWGVITVQHFMTDAGMSVKSDMHLCRTAKHLGFPIVSHHTPTRYECFAINDFAKTLVERWDIEVVGSKLRYLDLVLMHGSLKKIIDTRIPLEPLSRELFGLSPLPVAAAAA